MALKDLNTAAVANKGKAVELLHPASQVPIGIRFFVLGSDSEEFKRISRKQQAALLEKQKRNRGRGLYLQTPEEQEENALELLVAMTRGWEEDVRDKDGVVTGTRKEVEINVGEVVPFSAEAVRALYADPGFSWIREQVDAEVGDRRGFLPSVKGN